MESQKTLDDYRILVAAAIGAVSTVIGEIGSRLLLSLGLGSYSVYQENSLVITFNQPSMLIGFAINLLIGSVIGVSVYLITKRWGYRYIIMVSLILTLVTWTILGIAFNATVDENIVTSRQLSDFYNSLTNAIVHAVFKALMIKRFIFNKM